MLKEKYSDVLALGEALGVKDGDWTEEDGKLTLKGKAEYAYDLDRIWEKIKKHPNWSDEINAIIAVENNDIYGVYTVEKGDTLSGISKELLGEANRYKEIFNLNTDILSDPNKIQIGQKLKIPNR